MKTSTGLTVTPHGAVVVDTDGGVTRLVAPFNPALPPKAKAIGGRWDAATKSWQFDARDLPRVRDLAREVYGTDGTGDIDDVVTVRVGDISGKVYAVTVAGRTVAERRGRDQVVTLAAGVVIVEGEFAARGGSMRYPEVGDNNVVLEVRDIPRAAAESAGLHVVSSTQASREALRAERERLIRRLAEIDAELADVE